MRKYIFHLIGVTLLAFSFSSCSKKEHCDPLDKESPCYVGQDNSNKMLLVKQEKNGKPELEFEYDDQNHVIAIGIHPSDGSGLAHTYFTYNNKGLMIAVDHKKGTEHIYREEYTYGAEDKPISGTWTFKGGDVLFYQYIYSKNQVLEKTRIAEEEITHTYTFDDKGNPIMIEINSGKSMSTKQEFGDYDDKNYGFTNYPWRWKLRSINNARSYKTTAQGILVKDETWKYTYNTMGYPIKIEVVDKSSGNLVETRTLTYKAAN